MARWTKAPVGMHIVGPLYGRELGAGGSFLLEQWTIPALRAELLLKLPAFVITQPRPVFLESIRQVSQGTLGQDVGRASLRGL